MDESIKTARLDQTRREIARLRSELGDWLRRFNKSPGGYDENYGRHDSQLKAIKGEVDGAARIIGAALDRTDLNESVGAVYAKCALHDRQLVWLWRVFDFFRDKLAQRDVEGSLTERVLSAADDVIWSCYSPFFNDEKMKERRDPPPLPYVEAGYSPAALRRDQTPGSLVKRGTELDPLRECLTRMPIPLLQLPPVGLNSVWALALIGHEVGHFIQPAVLDDFAYVQKFREAVEQAVKAVSGSTRDEATHWGDWSPEIFADWYFVLTMGPWAVWVMGQFELADNAKMSLQRDGYPSRISRLTLLAELANHYVPEAGARMLSLLGLDMGAALWGDSRVSKDLEIARAVARTVTGPQPDGLGDLRDRLRFKATDYAFDPADTGKSGDVDKWAKTLQGRWSMDEQRDVRAARLIVAGAAQAWSEVLPQWLDLKREAGAARVLDTGKEAEEAEAVYPASAELINTRALEKIAATAVEGRRAAVEPKPKEGAGQALADYLMSPDAALFEVG